MTEKETATNQTRKHKHQKAKTNKPKNPKPQTQKQNITIGMEYPMAAMRRNDKAAYVPSPERVILETTAQGQNLTR